MSERVLLLPPTVQGHAREANWEVGVRAFFVFLCGRAMNGRLVQGVAPGHWGSAPAALLYDPECRGGGYH